MRYLKAANWVSKRVFKSKELNSNRLHRAFYATVRKKFEVPSQLTCNIFRQVAASYKTAKAMKRWKLCVYKQPTLPVTPGCDLMRSRKFGVRILGEIVTLTAKSIPVSGWRESKLKRIGKCWYLLLAHHVDVPEPKAEGCVVGVDFGVKRLMVATNSANSKTFFFKGGELNHRRTCIRHARAQIQSVGSRSSRRLLQRMRHNEAAVTGHLLHVASKALVKYAVDNGARRIVLEDLTNIRDSSLRARKDHRAKINRWPFAQGQFKIAYKAQNVGIATEYVDPRNTSRGCSACGNVSLSNRRGLHFHCKKCGHQEDADRNASKNIRLRSVVAAQVADAMGSFQPPKSAEPLDILTGSPVTHDELVGV